METTNAIDSRREVYQVLEFLRSIASRLRVLGGALCLIMLASSIHSVSAQDALLSCDNLGTPDVPLPAATAQSASVADIDLAYLTLQGILANSSLDLATMATTNLEHNELNEFAKSEITESEADQAALASLLDEFYPEADTDLYQLLAIVDQAKLELDLPAGEGGLESFGAVVGVSQICLSDGPYDDVYLASVMDLARQQIDLAQVAVVNSTNSDVIEFATALIERETEAIGQLLTWQNAWAEGVATPEG